MVLWLLGYPNAAARESEAAISMSEGLSPNSQAIALHFASMVHQLRRDSARTRIYVDRCASIAAEHGLSFWLAGSTVLRGWAIAARGDVGKGLAILRQGLRDWKTTGARTYFTYFMGILAETLLRQGAVTEAASLLDEALALADQTGEYLCAAELHSLRGQAAADGSGDQIVDHADYPFLEVALRRNRKRWGSGR